MAVEQNWNPNNLPVTRRLETIGTPAYEEYGKCDSPDGHQFMLGAEYCVICGRARIVLE